MCGILDSQIGKGVSESKHYVRILNCEHAVEERKTNPKKISEKILTKGLCIRVFRNTEIEHHIETKSGEVWILTLCAGEKWLSDLDVQLNKGLTTVVRSRRIRPHVRTVSS